MCFAVSLHLRANQRCVCVSSGVLVRYARCDLGVRVLSPFCHSISCDGFPSESFPVGFARQKPRQDPPSHVVVCTDQRWKPCTFNI